MAVNFLKQKTRLGVMVGQIHTMPIKIMQRSDVYHSHGLHIAKSEENTWHHSVCQLYFFKLLGICECNFFYFASALPKYSNLPHFVRIS